MYVVFFIVSIGHGKHDAEYINMYCRELYDRIQKSYRFH